MNIFKLASGCWLFVNYEKVKSTWRAFFTKMIHAPFNDCKEHDKVLERIEKTKAKTMAELKGKVTDAIHEKVINLFVRKECCGLPMLQSRGVEGKYTKSTWKCFDCGRTEQ